MATDYCLLNIQKCSWIFSVITPGLQLTLRSFLHKYYLIAINILCLYDVYVNTVIYETFYDVICIFILYPCALTEVLCMDGVWCILCVSFTMTEFWHILQFLVTFLFTFYLWICDERTLYTVYFWFYTPFYQMIFMYVLFNECKFLKCRIAMRSVQ